jgi:hypothetical protein
VVSVGYITSGKASYLDSLVNLTTQRTIKPINVKHELKITGRLIVMQMLIRNIIQSAQLNVNITEYPLERCEFGIHRIPATYYGMKQGHGMARLW